jgi:hypothetical protein
MSAIPPKADIRALAVGTGMMQHDDGTPTGGCPANFFRRIAANIAKLPQGLKRAVL